MIHHQNQDICVINCHYNILSLVFAYSTAALTTLCGFALQYTLPLGILESCAKKLYKLIFMLRVC